MIQKLFIACCLLIVSFAWSGEAEDAYNYAIKVSLGKMNKGLTPGQKNAYKAYLKAMEYKKQKDYQRSRLFDIYYEVAVMEVTNLYSPLVQHSEQMQEKADAANQQNDLVSAGKFEALASYFKNLAEGVNVMTTAAQKQDFLKMVQGMRQYVTAEGQILKAGAKPPKRSWLTVEEVRTLQSRLESKKAGK